MQFHFLTKFFLEFLQKNLNCSLSMYLLKIMQNDKEVFS